MFLIALHAALEPAGHIPFVSPCQAKPGQDGQAMPNLNLPIKRQGASTLPLFLTDLRRPTTLRLALVFLVALNTFSVLDRLSLLRPW